MPQQNIVVSITIPRSNPYTARIEYEEVSEDIQLIVETIWPNEPQPFMMPFLVYEVDTTAGNPEELYINAINYLMIRALATDISLTEFSYDLVVFCERFGRLFEESRISVLEARNRLGWQLVFMPILRNSIKEAKANKAYIIMLMCNVYDPYVKALSNYPDHKGNFVIDCAFSNHNNEAMQFFAHPATLKSTGFLLPNRNEGPKSNDRNEILKWCQKVALKNLNQFLEKNIRFTTEFDQAQGLVIKLKPQCLYAATVLYFLEGDIKWLSHSNVENLKGKRKSDYEDSFAKEERRSALSVFRNWKNRGKITQDEYDALRDYSDKLIPEHLCRDEMRERLETYLMNIRNRSRRSK